MKIGVASISFSKNQFLRREIQSLFPDVVFHDGGKKLSGDSLIEFAQECNALIVGTEKIDKYVLQNLPKLQIISKYGVGLDNLDLPALESLGVELRWTPGVNARSVAEQTLSFLILLFRNLGQINARLRRGVWLKDGGRQLTGKTIGILGFGNVGQEVARLIAPFDCRILGVDIAERSAQAQELRVKLCSLAEVKNSADLITIHTPLTSDTTGLVNCDFLGAMKSGSFLINTARGGIVVESDLISAIESGQIAGAALDVFEEEPNTKSGLLGMDNVFCTAHVGGNSEEAVLAMGRAAIAHIKNHCAY